MTSGKILGVLVAFFMLTTFIFAVKYSTARNDFRTIEQTIQERTYNERALIFTKLFIDKVLKAEGEISFEDRLQLENTVRGLNNQAIVDQWNAFVNSETEAEAQDAVKNLLSLLIDKIRTQ